MRNTLSYVVIALAVAVATWVVLGAPSPWWRRQRSRPRESSSRSGGSIAGPVLERAL